MCRRRFVLAFQRLDVLAFAVLRFLMIRVVQDMPLDGPTQMARDESLMTRVGAAAERVVETSR